MKAEERHRLHEHELRKLTLKAGDFWNRHGTKILAVLVGVGVIVVAVLIWTTASRHAAAEGWTKMAQSRTAEQFTAIAEDYEGEPVGHWARLRAAELHLEEGVRQAFSNRPAAIDELEEAVQQFARLLSARLPSEKLHERALYGHARSLESLAAVADPSSGKINATLSDAITAYERLLKAYPETIYKPIVENQIQTLKADRTQQFVGWFREQSVQPEDRALPRDGLPRGDLEGAMSPLGLPGGTAPLDSLDLPFTLPDGSDRRQLPPLRDPEGSENGAEAPALQLPDSPATPEDAEQPAAESPPAGTQP